MDSYQRLLKGNKDFVAETGDREPLFFQAC